MTVPLSRQHSDPGGKGTRQGVHTRALGQEGASPATEHGHADRLTEQEPAPHPSGGTQDEDQVLSKHQPARGHGDHGGGSVAIKAATGTNCLPGSTVVVVTQGHLAAASLEVTLPQE